MTRQEAIAILKHEKNHDIFVCTEWRKKIHEALEMAISSLETDEAYQLEYERTTEEKYCDRNICARNDVNGIGCEDCEVTKSQELITKNDLGVDCISRQEVIDLMMQKWGENFSGDDAMQESIDAIREMPSVTPQEPRWISVSERLPDTDNEVLCWYEYYHWSEEKILPEYGIGQYIDNKWYGEVGVGRDVRVIAWMPLPKPYEPQESEEQE